ncbi:MAG TPA: hypothetical protein VKT82_09430 [Ktedonobacterales bacterium]|nr:hypothetical protein [Ktedonobacterales bacterium]
MAGSQVSYENPETMYAQLTPEQRAALAQEFMQGFKESGDPKAQQFASIDPNTATPKQLAVMHQHARDEHPGVLGRVMRHPIATAVLGGFAAYEIDKHVMKK